MTKNTFTDSILTRLYGLQQELANLIEDYQINPDNYVDAAQEIDDLVAIMYAQSTLLRLLSQAGTNSEIIQIITDSQSEYIGIYSKSEALQMVTSFSP